MRNLKVGDSLIIGNAWGAIEYRGSGYFIAGGAGITPFISILRLLKKENKIAYNKLFFSNRTLKDVIYEHELVEILGSDNVIYVITDEEIAGYGNCIINREFLQKEVSDFKKHFYVCGPPQMTEEINEILLELGADPEVLIFER